MKKWHEERKENKEELREKNDNETGRRRKSTGKLR